MNQDILMRFNGGDIQYNIDNTRVPHSLKIRELYSDSLKIGGEGEGAR